MPHTDETVKTSEIHTRITIREDWWQRFVIEKNIRVALKEKFHLHQFQFQFFTDTLRVKAEVMEKPGSWLEIETRPMWIAAEQKLSLQEFKMDTKSKNVLVKSAGWLASFFQEKIDKRIEEKIQELFRSNLEKFLGQERQIPLNKQGVVNMNLENVHIHGMSFLERKIEVDVSIQGKFNLELKT